MRTAFLFFIFLSLKVHAIDSKILDTPLFGFDPTNSRIRTNIDLPDTGVLVFQDGKIIAHPASPDITKIHCYVSSYANFFSGTVLQVSLIEGTEIILDYPDRQVYQPRFNTTITMGVSKNAEASIDCFGPNDQVSEITLGQLQKTVGIFFEFIGFQPANYDLNKAGTFSELTRASQFRFEEDFISGGRRIHFQNGHVAGQWEEGPFCFTDSAWGHEIKKGHTSTVRFLMFEYDHFVHNKGPTSNQYLVDFGGPFDFRCADTAGEERNYRRPTIQDFLKSVGSLITLTL